MFGLFLNGANADPTLITIIVIALIILIMCSAFFSSCETAFSTANQLRLKTFLEEKRKGAQKALYITENYDRTLSTILVGNNLVNIAGTTIAAILFNRIIPGEALANVLNTVIMTILILIFGEILPKTYAKTNPEKFALRFSGLLYAIMKVLYPIVVCFMGLQKLVSRKKGEQVTMTEEELESIIDTMVQEGEIDDQDAELMHGMIESNYRTVYDIMVPRVDMVAIKLGMSIEEIKEIFFKYKFSRVPVYKEDKDNIIGILSERDFFKALIEHKKIDITKMVSAPLYVSLSMKSDDLIRKMQKEKKHFAVVTDEYGGTDGIVTLEDAIEVITGEIYDEHDEVEEEEIKKIDENSYLIDSEMSLDDLFELLKLGQTPESRYSDVGGFIYGLADELPEIGQTLDYKTTVYKQDEDGMTEEFLLNLHFTITEVVERRIKEVRLEISEINPEDESDDSKDEDLKEE